MVVYGETLNLLKLRQFQQKCGENFIILEAWNVLHNTVVLLRGIGTHNGSIMHMNWALIVHY